MPSSLQGDTALKHVFGKLTNMCWCNDTLSGLLQGLSCQCSPCLALHSLVLPVQGEAEADTNMLRISLRVFWVPDQALNKLLLRGWGPCFLATL